MASRTKGSGHPQPTWSSWGGTLSQVQASYGVCSSYPGHQNPSSPSTFHSNPLPLNKTQFPELSIGFPSLPSALPNPLGPLSPSCPGDFTAWPRRPRNLTQGGLNTLDSRETRLSRRILPLPKTYMGPSPPPPSPRLVPLLGFTPPTQARSPWRSTGLSQGLYGLFPGATATLLAATHRPQQKILAFLEFLLEVETPRLPGGALRQMGPWQLALPRTPVLPN